LPDKQIIAAIDIPINAKSISGFNTGCAPGADAIKDARPKNKPVPTIHHTKKFTTNPFLPIFFVLLRTTQSITPSLHLSNFATWGLTKNIHYDTIALVTNKTNTSVIPAEQGMRICVRLIKKSLFRSG
jgi:hypothetical protein